MVLSQQPGRRQTVEATAEGSADAALAYSSCGVAHYYQRGNPERAIADFRKVLELSDDPRVIGDAKKRLAALGAR